MTIGQRSVNLRWARDAGIGFFAFLLLTIPMLGHADAPRYEECRLDSLFPAGGCAGHSVTVDFFGNNGGLAEARGIVIDGPAGIAVEKVENVSTSQVRATLRIADDAVPGRRMLRVQNDRSGLTNMLYFAVGRLPERVESEPNNDPEHAESIASPSIVNGRVDPAADIDWFRFDAQTGQRIVVVVFAHALDSHGQGSNFGVVDANLTVLNENGRVLAESQDVLGLDPLIEFTVPANGSYFAKVQLVAFKGFREAVYRLAVGEAPVVTSVFPPSGTRGSALDVHLIGPHLPASGLQTVTLSPEPGFPTTFVAPNSPLATGQDVPIYVDDLVESSESEPNDNSPLAQTIPIGSAVHARFDSARDADWFRLKLKAGMRVSFETHAHRWLRSPADTRIEVIDATGKRIAENDDGIAIDYMSIHDHLSPDSQVTFAAPTDGEYFAKITESAGAFGPRSVYRLSARDATADFALFQFPDNVPIWGPGSTAALLVKVERSPSGFEEDIELSIAGLPEGWTGSQTISPGKPPRAPFFSKHLLLTITAPADAPVGRLVPFQVVGRARIGDRVIERIAQTMTLYYSSDTGFFRATPVSRAVITKPHSVSLAAPTRSFTIQRGGTIEVPIDVRALVGATSDSIALVANVGMYGVACGVNAPRTMTVTNGRAVIPVAFPSDPFPIGEFDFVVALSWRSDIRVGMPGPCTPLIRVQITE